MDKNALIQRLDEARAKLYLALEQVDPQTELCPGWTVKDMLAHISAWDEVCVDSLRVLAAGGEPQVTVFQGFDDFNDQATLSHKDMDYDEVFQELVTNRQQFIAAIEEIPAEMLTKRFTYPWGVSGTLRGVVKILAEHEEEHAEEIEDALRR